jgi:hypothetical protein
MKVRTFVAQNGRLTWPCITVALPAVSRPGDLEWITWLDTNCPKDDWYWRNLYTSPPSKHCFVYIKDRGIAAWFKLLFGSANDQ